MSAFNSLLRYLILLFCFISFNLLSETIKIRVGVSTSTELPALKIKLKRCNEIVDYTHKDLFITDLDPLIICRALYLGGLKPEFEYIEFKDYDHKLKNVHSGKITLMLNSAWLRDANLQHVYMSQPLIAKGDFKKAIFVRPSNKKILKITQLSQLKNFTALSNRKWKLDWEFLKQHAKNVYSVSDSITKARMLKAGRVDFILSQLSKEPDHSKVIDQIKLIPIPNIRIVLNESRHVLINNNHPNSLKILSALEKGLSILRKNNTIKQAYEQTYINQHN